ncbi:MAG: hypothetical protein WA162_03125 [Thermodesulfobacteriota bacterium]
MSVANSQPYEVIQYNIEHLKDLFVKKAGSFPHVVSNKSHLRFFDEYFKKLNTQTIVVENNYVDRDFLEDFTGYYARCFEDYKRKCVRLHFFNIVFTTEFFDSILSGICEKDADKKLQSAYLGFIVVKPLPQTIIGRTCLKTYPPEGRRIFPSLRKYEVNLFGINLYLDSLAFQEQDKVVAACATSALWSAFHGTGKFFHHHIPSPVEITKLANTFPEEGNTRSLPSEGLTCAQMAYAIQRISLEPFLINIKDLNIMKTNVYAYLKLGIPLVMGIVLYDVSQKPHKPLGKHAVTITGYNLDSTILPSESYSFLKASRINKIYVHDDQVGPFARMVFDGKKVSSIDEINEEKFTEVDSLDTSWGAGIRAIPEILLAPLYHKIRIPFNAVRDMIRSFDLFIESLRELELVVLSRRLEWDIYLTTVSEFKKSIFTSNDVVSDYRKDVLSSDMPRFIWRATALNSENKKVLDLLFDATDIEQGAFFLRAVEYDRDFALKLRTLSGLLNKEEMFNKLKIEPVWKFLGWFAKKHEENSVL